MDSYGELQNNVSSTTFWNQNLVRLNQISHFVPFKYQPFCPVIPCYGSSSTHNKININKRKIEFLRSSSYWSPGIENSGRKKEINERCFKHMMGERMRRMRHKDCYSALHSMLPMGTKKDKNSIVQTAAVTIQQLQRYKEDLRRKEMELEMKINMAAANYDYETSKEMKETSKIRLKVANPTSGVDSMVEALRCSKHLGLKTISIRSTFSSHEFSAELEMETKIGAVELKEAMQQTLFEAEMKHLYHFQEHGGN